MKKFYISLLSLFLVLGVMVGCSQPETNQESTTNKQSNQTDQEESVVITISQNNGEEIITEEELEVEEGAILMDVLKENFEIEETDGFITSIEGVSIDEDEGSYWIYDVNGQMASVGAHEYELHANDAIVFDLHAMD